MDGTRHRVGDATVSSLVTLSASVMGAAFSSTLVFSTPDRTGPLKRDHAVLRDHLLSIGGDPVRLIQIHLACPFLTEVKLSESFRPSSDRCSNRSMFWYSRRRHTPRNSACGYPWCDAVTNRMAARRRPLSTALFRPDYSRDWIVAVMLLVASSSSHSPQCVS